MPMEPASSKSPTAPTTTRFGGHHHRNGRIVLMERRDQPIPSRQWPVRESALRSSDTDQVVRLVAPCGAESAESGLRATVCIQIGFASISVLRNRDIHEPVGNNGSVQRALIRRKPVIVTPLRFDLW